MIRGGPAAFISLNNIFKVFHTQAGEVTVLKEINLAFSAGEFVAIVGKSGSGKSTLVNMITGIDHPTRGTVVIDGANLHTLREGQLAVWRGRTLGVVFQFFQLLPMLTVRENILLPMDLAGLIPWEQREDRVRELLEMVGCADLAEKLPGTLSGGQQQTATIARALANDPPILVADEPTGNLDSATAETLFKILQELSARGKTILMVTHDMGLANRIRRRVILCDGETIDERLSNAFPELPHPQLLELTHAFACRSLAGGQAIRSEELTQFGLALVGEGRVQLVFDAAGSNREEVPLFQTGQALPLAPLQKEAPWKIMAPEGSGSDPLLLLIPMDTLERCLAAYPAAWRALLERASHGFLSPSHTGKPGRPA